MIWIYQVSILHILSVYFLLITFISLIFYTEDNYQNLAKELSELRMKYNQLEQRNEEISKHAEKVFRKINHLRENNEMLANINLDFSNENAELKKLLS